MGIAPNNGFKLASYDPLNPCSNADAANLDYSQGLFKGGSQNSMQCFVDKSFVKSFVDGTLTLWKQMSAKVRM
jgi:hypothetical protein